MTYLTAQPTADGVQFMPDHYGRDAHLMERFGTQLMAAVRGLRPLAETVPRGAEVS